MPHRTVWLVLAWCLALAVGIVSVQRNLTVSGDLRHFMPEPRTDAQRLLLQNIGEGPASRLLLLAVGGEDPRELARISRELATALAGAPEIRFVANGAGEIDTFPDELLAYRYLLTDSFDRQPLDAPGLALALRERVADLASPAAGLIEEWLPRDPTLELAHLASRWQPREEPRRVEDVWFTAAGNRALLIAETRAAAFDPDAQALAIRRIETEFARARGASDARLTLSGSGYFGVTIKQGMQREAAWFGAAATAGLIGLMWLGYRRWRLTLLGALPLLSGGVAGLLVTATAFETVHGITLAFGFTLIGVAQDYPVHLFSHLRRGQAPQATAREVWPPLATGVVSTCIGYAAFLLSGVDGLMQLGCFTITGLAVAALLTRFVLPQLIGEPQRDVAQLPMMHRLEVHVASLPRMDWLLLFIPLVCGGALFFARGSFWQNDLSRLTPVSAELLREDAGLRQELDTPDLRHLLVVTADSPDRVLTRLESMDAALEGLRVSGGLTAYDHAARVLPSAAVQRARQQALPPPEPLRSMLVTANQDAGFEDGVFEPFVADVERARRLPVLEPEAITDTALGARVGSLLFQREGGWHGLVVFHGLRDPDAVAMVAAAQGEVTFLDLKGASEELVTAQRGHMLSHLAIAALALLAVVFLALRNAHRLLRVAAPMFLSSLIIVTVLRVTGVELNLFHLVSLVLAAGLGLDYALFFEHSAADPERQRRTLHALLVCATSTLCVFALLLLSSAPVLRAIGVTVSIGVISNFLLALILSRARRPA